MDNIPEVYQAEYCRLYDDVVEEELEVIEDEE